VTIKLKTAHVIADILEAALPGELDPRLSDTYVFGPRGGVHGVDHHYSAGPSPRRYDITQALNWRSDRIHHGETLSYAPGGPGRYARYGSGCRLPAGPTTDAILAVWIARNVRQVEAGQLSVVVDRLISKLAAQEPVDRKAVAALRKLANGYRRWERARAFSADDPSSKPARLAALVERADLRWLRRPVLEALAANLSTPGEALLPVLAELADVDVASLGLAIQPGATRDEALLELAQSQGLPEPLVDQIVWKASPSLEVLLVLARHQSSPVLVRMAGDQQTAPELLAAFAASGDSNLRWLVAGNSATPLELLTAMAVRDVEASVGERLVRNPRIPPELLAVLASAEQKRVRIAVATSYHTPTEVLVKLAGDDAALVRDTVVRNDHTPTEVLVKLAGDSDRDVRSSVANNRHTPTEVLVKLAGDSDSYVRSNVANNPRTPPEVLVKLAGDSDYGVRHYATHNPSTPKKSAR